MRIPIESSTSYRGRNARPNWLLLALFIGVAMAAGVPGAIFSPRMSAASGHWYAMLAKPAWTPPDSWLGPVWMALYALMGTAAWLIWRERYHRSRNSALAAYAIQLLLNAAWAPLFFGARNIGAGLFMIVALWLAIAWTIREFAAVRGCGGVDDGAVLVWVSFASALNYAVWKLNP